MIDQSFALPWVWLNGKITRASVAGVSVFDRSFTLGDGVFDTLRILNECPLQWRAHWRRFTRSARLLRIKIPLTESECRAALHKLLTKNQKTNAIARIHLSRGTSPRGYSIARADMPMLVISLHPPTNITPGEPVRWKLKLATSPFLNSSLLTAHKTASRAFHIATKMEADRAGFDDALILNDRGEVMEAISSNVFWMSADTIRTPPLDRGILPGTARDRIIKLCQNENIKWREGTVMLSSLLKADAVFLSVSTSGIIEVVQIENTKLKRHPAVAELHEKLELRNLREARQFMQRRLRQK